MSQAWDYLDLGNIRATLIRQEDTILFGLIERAQFKRNEAVYQDDADFMKGTDIAVGFSQHLLEETEKIHAKARRYTSPDEKPFTARDKLPEPILPPLVVTTELKPLQIIDVNLNKAIMEAYRSIIIPDICQADQHHDQDKLERSCTERQRTFSMVPTPPVALAGLAPARREGDDGQYGSTAVCDIQILQALSKRIHYGAFVAESKFRSQPEEYTRLIKARDREGLMALLTNKEVEDSVVRRVQLKATAYGQEISDDKTLAHGPPVSEEELRGFKVNPQVMGKIYRDTIIPLTKDVEVEYLLQRA